jgi:hypothetical protein
MRKVSLISFFDLFSRPSCPCMFSSMSPNMVCSFKQFFRGWQSERVPVFENRHEAVVATHIMR